MERGELSVDAEARIDTACDRYESSCLEGDPPRIEDHLGECEGLERAVLFRELLALEVHYRRQRGDEPRPSDYRARFPDYPEGIDSVFADLSPGSDSSVSGLPTLPGYEILEVLGRGGMGVVYKARQTSLNRIVAVKMMLSDNLDPEQLSRFRREAETIAKMQHPNIVQIYEVGDHEGKPYIALEYAEGGTLEDRAAGTRSFRELAELLSMLARAVHAAHEQGVLHRDIKPANVLLSSQGTPKVTDFGLARRLDMEATHLTVSGAVLGTPSYMAPEQAYGSVSELSAATDVYALGATFYEMITGHPPFAGSSLLDTLEQVCTRDPIPPGQLVEKLPRDLETICLKCLRKSAKDRYASAGELADDIDRFLRGESIQAKSLNIVDRLARMLERSHMDNEFQGWANLLLFFGVVVFVCQAVFCWQMHVGHSTAGLMVTRLVQVAAMVGGVLWFRKEAFTPRSQAERQMWSIWVGFILACTFAAGANRLLFGSGRTFQSALYPMWTAFSGMGFFALGSMYWGGCYLIGFGFFVLALLMPYHIELAPLSYGALWFVVLA